MAGFLSSYFSSNFSSSKPPIFDNLSCPWLTGQQLRGAWCSVQIGRIPIHVARTNIDINDGLVHRVMVRYHLKTKREAVEYALRHLAGQPLSTSEALALGGSMPDFAAHAEPIAVEVLSGARDEKSWNSLQQLLLRSPHGCALAPSIA